MSSPYSHANLSPYKTVNTPYQITPSYNYGLPWCPSGKVAKPVLTGPQNMYYMVTRVSSDMASSFSGSYKDTLHGSWNTWLSVLQENNGQSQPVMVAPFLPGNCSPVQNNTPIKGAQTQVAVPIWFEDGGQGGDHVLLSYTDSGTGVFVGNSYRVCTFGFEGITNPYSTPPVCGNAISTSPQTQSSSDSYCLGCSPSEKTVLYLSWIDDNFYDGAVILGWMRPNCAKVSMQNSQHVMCEETSDCDGFHDVGFPSLRGAAVDFYFTLGDYHANTPTFPPLSSSRPPFLQMGDTFTMSMQGEYWGSSPSGYSGWGLNFPCPLYFDSYGPHGDSPNNVRKWKLYGYMPVRNNSPSYSSNDNLGYFQVVPLGNGAFPTPSAYCDSPPKSGYDWYCGGTSLAAWQTNNSSCTPSHTTCIRNSFFSGWQCLGSVYGTPGGGGGVCTGTCSNVAGVCDSSGNCVNQNALLYTPKCTNGKWSCVKKDSSWIAIALALLVFTLLVVWFFVS